MASLYNTNKQQQPYIDDDLVSDYSTVIRNSRLPPHEQQQQKSMPPPRPSIPLDMNLIASSPRLSTLVERQGSISSTHTDRHRQQLEQQRLRLQQQQQQIQMQQRPISHQVAPASTSVITNGSSEWKRNTMNNIQSQEVRIFKGKRSCSRTENLICTISVVFLDGRCTTFFHRFQSI